MTLELGYRLLADLVLFIHAALVLFVVAGLVLVFTGGLRDWAWVRNPWFRLVHLAVVAVVVVQAWLGALCPLTYLEIALRERAGDAVYQGSFIAYWVERLLYYQAPQWVFVLLYSLFGLAVVASWLLVRPCPLRNRRSWPGFRRR